MKTFIVTFKDELYAESEEACYEQLLQYLADCVRYQDVVAFDFVEVKESHANIPTTT